MALGNDGYFYGITQLGGIGSLARGTVFKVSTNGVLTTLVTFTNGEFLSSPYLYTDTGLILGNDGNFYGTTESGGTSGYGSVFKITTNGVLTTLVSFNGTNGLDPEASLILGQDGNFYGTTDSGGLTPTGGDGTVFQMTPNGVLNTLVIFNGTNGWEPDASLIIGNDGSFYGTTMEGTNLTLNGGLGFGTIFKLTPPVTPAPALAISTYSNQPAVFFPTTTGTNYVLQMSTNLASGNWVTVSNGIPISGLIITNPPANAFFRLH